MVSMKQLFPQLSEQLQVTEEQFLVGLMEDGYACAVLLCLNFSMLASC